MVYVRKKGEFILSIWDSITEEDKKKYDIEEYDGEIEKGCNNEIYVKGHAPVKPEPTKEDIRATREQLFSSSPCSDYKYDYEEAVARYGADSEQAKQTCDIWLAQKDKIRAENPYPVEV